MINFLKASAQSPNQRFNPLEFPETQGKLSISAIKGKGRGLVAEQVFEPGDTIIAHRAIDIIFPTSTSDRLSSSLLNQVKKFRLLKESIARLISADEEIKTKVYALSAGPKLGFIEEPSENIGGGVVAAELKRIEGIILVNGFQGPSITVNGQDGPFGLWYLPSFINHNCSNTNANWCILNDFMFIRAVKKIQTGEEILISYIDPDQPYFVRRELFLKHDFLCNCKLCLIEAEEGAALRNERDGMLSEFKNSDNVNSSNREHLINILERLKSIRPVSDNNPFVLQPLMQIGLSYYEDKLYEDAISIFAQAIEVAKVFLQFAPVAISLTIAILRCFGRNGGNGDAEEVKKWTECLKYWMHLVYGCNGDEELIEIIGLTKPAFVTELKEHFVR